MSTPRLSLVMGGSTSAPDGSDVSLPVPESGTVHLHLHLAGAPPSAPDTAKRAVGGWSGLLIGVGLMAAFAGGYQFGHRPASDDVSNLRPMPALGGVAVTEPAMPSPAGGLPAIQRQLATPPQIILPQRAPQQPGTPAASSGSAVPGRNAFGLEN